METSEGTIEYFFKDQNQVIEDPGVSYGIGVMFSQAEKLMSFLGLSQHEVAELLEVDPSTLFRWRKEDKPVGRLRSKLLKEMDAVVAKGVFFFGSEEAFDQWLHTPNYAFGGALPVSYMKDPYTIVRVSEAIDAMSWGSYI